MAFCADFVHFFRHHRAFSCSQKYYRARDLDLASIFHQQRNAESFQVVLSTLNEADEIPCRWFFGPCGLLRRPWVGVRRNGSSTGIVSRLASSQPSSIRGPRLSRKHSQKNALHDHPFVSSTFSAALTTDIHKNLKFVHEGRIRGGFQVNDGSNEEILPIS